MLLGVALGLAVFTVYVATAAPGITGGDSGDLVTATYSSGVAHAPGYPLYLLLGQAFSLLPLGDLAYRLNLMSAVSAALSVFVIYLIALRLTGRLIAAIVASGALAFAPRFWSYALVAEVFSLNGLFAALLVLLALEWRNELHRLRWPYALSLTVGLSLAHHHMIVLLFPALLYLLWAPLRGLLGQGRAVLCSACLMLAGLLPYAYLPVTALRQPAYSWGDPSSLDRFITFVARSDYGTLSLIGQQVDDPSAPLWQLSLYFGAMLEQYALWGISLGLLGLYYLWRRSSTVAISMAGAFLLSGPAFVVYANVAADLPGAMAMLQKFYLLSFLVFAIAIGAGAWALVDSLETRFRVNSYAFGSALLLVMIYPVSSLLINWSAVDQSRSFLARDFGRDVLAGVQPNGVVLANSDDALFILQYQQLVEGARPDVAIINPWALPLDWYQRQVRSLYPDLALPTSGNSLAEALADFVGRNSERRPIYIVSSTGEDLASDFELVPRGLVLAIYGKGKAPDLDEVWAENQVLWDSYSRRAEVRAYHRAAWQSSVMEDYAGAPFALGLRYHSARRYDDAIALYQRAIRMNPNFAPSYANLGDIYWSRKHDAATALDYLERYLALQAYSGPAPQVRQDVEVLRTQISARPTLRTN